VIATAELFNDWEKSRTPSHSDVTEQIERSELAHADIRAGKKKRIRQVLTWALENDETLGRRAVQNMLDLARGSGGFLEQSSNYVGVENVKALQAAFRVEGCVLTDDGTIMPVLLVRPTVIGDPMLRRGDILELASQRGRPDACRQSRHGVNDVLAFRLIAGKRVVCVASAPGVRSARTPGTSSRPRSAP
jgi:hypothetical protein